MCGKIMTVLLIFVVLNCSMARYNGRLHCRVGVLPTCYKRKAATYFYPPGGTGHSYIESDFTHNYVASQKINVKRKRSHCLVAIFFFCHIDLHSGYAFSSDCTKIVSQ